MNKKDKINLLKLIIDDCNYAHICFDTYYDYEYNESSDPEETMEARQNHAKSWLKMCHDFRTKANTKIEVFIQLGGTWSDVKKYSQELAQFIHDDLNLVQMLDNDLSITRSWFEIQ